jgi:hypothetical protein
MVSEKEGEQDEGRAARPSPGSRGGRDPEYERDAAERESRQNGERGHAVQEHERRSCAPTMIMLAGKNQAGR